MYDRYNPKDGLIVKSEPYEVGDNIPGPNILQFEVHLQDGELVLNGSITDTNTGAVVKNEFFELTSKVKHDKSVLSQAYELLVIATRNHLSTKQYAWLASKGKA